MSEKKSQVMPDQYWVFEADTNICEFIFVINTYHKYIGDKDPTIFFKLRQDMKHVMATLF